MARPTTTASALQIKNRRIEADSPASAYRRDTAYHRESPLRTPARGNGGYCMVGMTKLESTCSSAESGQRAVTVLVLVQKRTPSMPCWLMSPKAERFQPPKVW